MYNLPNASARVNAHDKIAKIATNFIAMLFNSEYRRSLL